MNMLANDPHTGMHLCGTERVQGGLLEQVLAEAGLGLLTNSVERTLDRVRDKYRQVTLPQ
jgi:hypothetical protein